MGQWTLCNEDALIEYARGRRGQFSDELERHLKFCATCSTAVADYATLQERFAQPISWTAPTQSSLETIVRRFEEIRAFAERGVSALLDLSDEERYTTVSADDAYFTAEVAWKLLDAAYRIRRDSPHDSIPLLRLAAFVADGVVNKRRLGNYAACQVSAWKELAYTYGTIGEYKDADAALARAAAAAMNCTEPERASMIARVTLQRGILMTTMRQFTTAMDLVDLAYAAFRRLGDSDRAEMALECRANIFMHQQNGAAAADTLRRLVFAEGDDATKARRYQNFAYALELSGNLAAAAIYIRVAIDLHKKLKATYFIHKDRWTLGRILDKAGRIMEAFAELNCARDFMLTADPHGAVMIDLDICEIQIRRELATESTYDRLRSIANFAIEKKLPEAACKALLFLQRRGAAVALRDVKLVRQFIAELHEHPHREFVEPEVAA